MRKHNFLIGYEGENQCAYGKEVARKLTYAEPMTLWQAKKLAKKTFCINNNRKVKTVVYKLVRVKGTP